MPNILLKDRIFSFEDMQYLFENKLTKDSDIYGVLDFSKEPVYSVYNDLKVQAMFSGFVAGFWLRHSEEFKK